MVSVYLSSSISVFTLRLCTASNSFPLLQFPVLFVVKGYRVLRLKRTFLNRMSFDTVVTEILRNILRQALSAAFLVLAAVMGFGFGLVLFLLLLITDVCALNV